MPARRRTDRVDSEDVAEALVEDLLRPVGADQTRPGDSQQEIAEREAKQRQLAEGTRFQAEQAVVNLAKEAADALRRYDEAKRQAEYEAKCRIEAEQKRKAVEEEINRIAAAEAERHQPPP